MKQDRTSPPFFAPSTWIIQFKNIDFPASVLTVTLPLVIFRVSVFPSKPMVLNSQTRMEFISRQGLIPPTLELKNDMYLLTWNADQNTVYAGLGGVVTQAESVVLADEITQLLDSVGPHRPTVELDACRATRFADGAFDELEKLRFVCAQKGAKLSLITEERDEPMSPNVRAILDGHAEELYEVRLAS